jgi:hypothetical protein
MCSQRALVVHPDQNRIKNTCSSTALRSQPFSTARFEDDCGAKCDLFHSRGKGELAKPDNNDRVH